MVFLLNEQSLLVRLLVFIVQATEICGHLFSIYKLIFDHTLVLDTPSQVAWWVYVCVGHFELVLLLGHNFTGCLTSGTCFLAWFLHILDCTVLGVHGVGLHLLLIGYLLIKSGSWHLTIVSALVSLIVLGRGLVPRELLDAACEHLLIRLV